MVSNKTVSLALLSLLCTSSAASAKFSFSRELLRQFDIRRRHTMMGPSNVFRPAAPAPTPTPASVAAVTPSPDTVTVTVSTTSTTTGRTIASTTVTDMIATSAAAAAVPAPVVVQMHTTRIAIIPRVMETATATRAAHAKLRMRKICHAGLSLSSASARAVGDDEYEEDGTMGDAAAATALPPSEHITAIKHVHLQRALHVDEGPLSSLPWAAIPPRTGSHRT